MFLKLFTYGFGIVFFFQTSFIKNESRTFPSHFSFDKLINKLKRRVFVAENRTENFAFQDL